MRGLFVFFIIMPIVEMMLLFKVSDQIGGLYTIGLVMLTAVIGVQVLKQQGLATFTRANKRLNSGDLPGQEIIEGMFLAVGGAFLLTPGFITDTLGFIFLIGPSRRFLVSKLIKSGKLTTPAGGSGGGFQVFTSTQFSSRFGQGGARPQEQDEIIEAEFEREVPKDSRLDKPDKH